MKCYKCNEEIVLNTRIVQIILGKVTKSYKDYIGLQNCNWLPAPINLSIEFHHKCFMDLFRGSKLMEMITAEVL